jgi:hypothetical protein
MIDSDTDKFLAVSIDEPPHAVDLLDMDKSRRSLSFGCLADACGKDCCDGNQQAKSYCLHSMVLV